MLNDPASFLTRYCSAAPASRLVGALIAPLLVMLSLLNPALPFVLSVVNAMSGAAATKSEVNVFVAVDFAPTAKLPPATAVASTFTV